MKKKKKNKLIVDIAFDFDAINSAIKFIQERDNRGLNYLAIKRKMSRTLLDDFKCKSITTFELKGDDMNFVNPLLEWKMIVEKGIFVVIDVHEDRTKYDKDLAGLSLFKRLCQNACQLFARRNALDIKIEFTNVWDPTIFDSYVSIYSSYFGNEQFVSGYNKPKCNSHLCLPRDKPYTYLYTNYSTKRKCFMFCASNAHVLQSN